MNLSKKLDLTTLRAVTESFSKARIMCIGDVVLDRFIYGSISRMSSEAPIPVVVEDHRKSMLGCAGNAAANIASLGGNVHLISTVGNDDEAAALRNIAKETLGSDIGLVTDDTKPTTLKTRILSNTTQVARFDREVKTDISHEAFEEITKVIKKHIENTDELILV